MNLGGNPHKGLVMQIFDAKQTVELPVIWDVIMFKWPHWNIESFMVVQLKISAKFCEIADIGVPSLNHPCCL